MRIEARAEKRKERKALTLENFRGIDTLHAITEIGLSRAAEMQNLICENGVNRKRRGWKAEAGFSGTVHGIFKHPGIEGDLIILAGTGAYLYDAGNGTVTALTGAGKQLLSVEVLPNFRSAGFYSGYNLYILTGANYYAYRLDPDGGHNPEDPDAYGFVKVWNDAATFVPTTTISIDNDGELDDVRASLDDVNLFSPRRKNKLVGTSAPAWWTLDGAAYRVAMKTSSDGDTADGENIYKSVSDGVYTYDVFDITVEVETENGVDRYATRVNEDYPWRLCAENKTVHGFVKGIYDGGVLTGTKIYLIDASDPPIPNASNITVDFLHLNPTKEPSIKASTVGTVFGINGAADRLYMARGATDYFSEAGDFTYIGDLNYTQVGISGNPICGYVTLTDNVLMTVKKETDTEPTVYYRTGSYVTVTDDDGNVISMLPRFSMTAGTSGKGAAAFNGTAVLGDDPLIISDDGIYGVELGSNITVKERYAKKRSSLVDGALPRDKSGLFACVSGERLWISADDNAGTVYVADRKYTTVTQEKNTEYEWWIQKNVPAHCFHADGDTLWFGTKTGKLCRFYEGYEDTDCYWTAAGQISFTAANAETGTVGYHAEELDGRIEDGKAVEFSALPKAVADRPTAMDGEYVITADPAYMKYLRNGMTVYDLNGVNGVIKNIDRSAGTYEIEGITALPTVVLINLNETFFDSGVKRRLYIGGVDRDANTFTLSLSKGGEALEFYNDGNVPTGAVMRILDIRPVDAYMISGATDFGSPLLAKSILKLNVVCDPNTDGKLTFGFNTASHAKEIEGRGREKADMTDISFEGFTFDTSFAKAYTVKALARKINFARFFWRSNDNKPCAVTGITAVYRIDKEIRGVN